MTLLASGAMGAEGTGYYDGAYARSSEELYAAIRRDAFGEDIGQFSWLTADEYGTFADRLAIDTGSHVLEVACGTGGPALFLASRTGCRVTGVDLHEAGSRLDRPRPGAGPADRARFVQAIARLRAAFRRRDVRRAHLQRRLEPLRRSRGRARRVVRVLRLGARPRLHGPHRRHGDAQARRDGGAERFDGRVRPHASRCGRTARPRCQLRRRQGRGTRRPTCGKCHGAGAKRASSVVPSSTRSKARRKRGVPALSSRSSRHLPANGGSHGSRSWPRAREPRLPPGYCCWRVSGAARTSSSRWPWPTWSRA